MFYPLPLFLGLRYVRSRSKGFFVSFISWTSMLGIAVGLGALITILSIMNGFEREVRTGLLSLAAHATLSAEPARMHDWERLAERIRAEPDVVGVAPYLDLQGMLGRGVDMRGARVRGILPELEDEVSSLAAHMVAGSLEDLTPGSQHIVLGAGLAWAIDAQVGDEITLLVPVVGPQGSGAVAGVDLQARARSFLVSGIFEVGLPDHDNTLAMIHLEDAAALADTDGAPGGLRIEFTDIFLAPVRAQQIARQLEAAAQVPGAPGQPSGFAVSDWSKEHASYFRAVRIEKTMMTLIMMLVVAVAAFNIVAALVMVVNEKRTDIAILRTVGLSPRAVLGVFVTQGVFIGWFGALLGLALGLTLALNVETIVPALEAFFGVRIMDPSVYVISTIPSEVRWQQVVGFTAAALILTVLATIYPALRGAATEPAEALRYE